MRAQAAPKVAVDHHNRLLVGHMALEFGGAKSEVNHLAQR